MNTAEFPKRVEIELSSVCNLHCDYCPRRFVSSGLGHFLDTALFYRVIDEIVARKTTSIVLHRRGESLMHPDFLAILRYCQGKFSEVQLATNATLLTPEKIEVMTRVLTFLSFSIDLPERLATVRGADYDLVARNIEAFLRRNSGVQTQVSMVRTPEVTDADAARFMKLWEGKVDRIRVYEEHSRDGAFGSLCRERPDRRPCVKPFLETVVLSTGDIARCNHDWDSPPLGNITDKTIADVWRSPVYESLREQQRTLAFTDATCAACGSWYAEVGVQGTGTVRERSPRDGE